ncbi:extracellular solute-binding protein [Candidatus Sumerlaeota bacterium]|nr:extracellular solute-binding protein [Candidatus Sumerlaeota bacterium]
MAACAILGACGGSPAGRQVVVLSPHGQEILDEYESAFEAAYPDIDLVGRLVPTGQILSQLRIDQDSPKVDVWWGGTSAFFTQAKEAGLFQPYRPSWAEFSQPSHHDGDDTWYAQFLQVPAIMFNSNIYSAEEVPGTWEELLSPAWNGKIVIREPMDSGTMKTIFTGLIWSLGGEEHDPAAGFEFLRRLDAQTRTYLPSPQALYERIAKSEEGYISVWNLTDILLQSESNGYPFGYRIPADPVPVSLDPIAIIAGAPNLEEARVFYEFVTSKESCLRLARDYFRILARSDIAEGELPSPVTGLQFDTLEIDLAEFDRLQIQWMQHWLDEIRDPGK